MPQFLRTAAALGRLSHARRNPAPQAIRLDGSTHHQHLADSRRNARRLSGRGLSELTGTMRVTQRTRIVVLLTPHEVFWVSYKIDGLFSERCNLHVQIVGAVFVFYGDPLFLHEHQPADSKPGE